MANKPSPADFSPTVPDFPNIGTYQPVYGKFDLTTYIQGASDYEIMAFLVQCYNATLKGYSDVTQLSKDTVTAYNQLQTWVNTWFDNLDIQPEINAKLQEMYENGSLAEVIASSDVIILAMNNYLNTPAGSENLYGATSRKLNAMAADGTLTDIVKDTGQVSNAVVSYLNSVEGSEALANATATKIDSMAQDGSLANVVSQTNKIPEAVKQYLDSVDGTKNLSDVTAKKIEAMAADGTLGTVISNTGSVQSTTTNWLKQNVTPVGSAVVVDKSLSIEGAAADAKTVGGELAYNLPYFTYNTITDCNYVTNQSNNVLHDAFNAAIATPTNVPNNFVTGVALWHLFTYYVQNGFWTQYLTDGTTVYTRSYNGTQWQLWDNISNRIRIDYNTIDGTSINTIFSNGIRTFNLLVTPKDLPFDDWKDGTLWAVINFEFSLSDKYIEQVVLSIDNPFGKKQAYRQTNAGGTTWQNWNIYNPTSNNSAGKIITCTPKTTLRAACEEAISTPNTSVVVKPGTYDLTIEFSDHITAQSGSGIKLSNGIKLIFEAGSHVKAEIETATEYSQNEFAPFYTAGDFEIIGLDISAKNTRYCVHDESGGTGTQHHIYRNCRMKYRNDSTTPHYSQCIGGGMGEHTFIEIHGGTYDSKITHNSGDETPKQLDTPITYHNGYTTTCDGKIFIDGVYLKNDGYFRFGYYGASTIVTPIEISNCSVGQATVLKPEVTGQQTPENLELIEFNVTVRP